MGNKNARCIRSVARVQYVNWLTDPRIIIVLILFIVMKTIVVDALLERAGKFGDSLNALEPFVAIGNSGVLVMLIPCVFFIMISDYPKMTGNTLFFIQRTGKRNWYFGQMLFLMEAIASIILSSLLVSMVLSKGKMSAGWSDVVTRYEARFPSETGNFVSAYLPSNLYNQLSLYSAFFQTIILLILYLFLLSMIIYFFKLIHIQSFGVLAAMAVVAAGVVTTSLDISLKWFFPTANTIVWLHYTEILREAAYPIWASYVYFIALNILMGTINYFMVKRLELTNIELM